MGFITDILKEVPLSAVLKERLSEADTKAEALQMKVKTLQKENTNLRQLIKEKDRQIGTLKQDIESLKKPQPRGAWGSQPRIKGRMEQ